MKTKFKSLSNQRVYIRNFVDRYYKGSTKCVNCGKEKTSIVHNAENPYCISFICDDCRIGLDKETLNSLPKVNILDNIEVNRKFSHIKNLVLTEDLKNIIENALTTELSLTEYLKENKLSYNKYREAVNKYEKEIKPIRKKLKQHFNYLRADKISNSIKNSKNS